MKIEKINADEFEDLGAWINALTDKVNELVDKYNQSIETQNIKLQIDKKELTK